MDEEVEWVTCGTRLLTMSQKIGRASQALPMLYHKHMRKHDIDFVKHVFAVIYVESRFNKQAVSEQDAYGLMQMTVTAVQEAQKRCKLRPLMSMNALFDSATNIKYGSCYLSEMLNEAEGDWTRALILYNGGYRALAKYDNGDSINNETANYVLQVEKALRDCSSNEKEE